MGKIKNNLVTQGFSGKFGDDITFRQIGGKTFFAKRAVRSALPSERQLAMRDKFGQASWYASNALADPQVYQHYKIMAKFQGLRSAYLAATADFLTTPEIGALNTSAYLGKAGDLISITSLTPYKITEIDVRILAPDGTVVESGKAVVREPKWHYRTTVDNLQVSGSRVIVTAHDRQGETSTIERVL